MKRVGCGEYTKIKSLVQNGDAWSAASNLSKTDDCIKKIVRSHTNILLHVTKVVK